MLERNPIISYKGLSIKVIGDPHLGRTFKTGVPSSKYGLREKILYGDFSDHLRTPNVDIVIIVGDLFDKFIVSPTVLLKTYKILLEAISTNTDTHYLIIPGNHDLSKNVSISSSYELLYTMLESDSHYDNIEMVFDKNLLTSVKGLNIFLDSYDPFYETNKDKEERVPEVDIDLYIGHWDDPRVGEGYLPNKDILSKSSLVLSGHIHTPFKTTYSGTEIYYVGSMQPYSHGEDPACEKYVTFEYKDLEAVFEEKGPFNSLVHQEYIDSLFSMNVRINCYPGYVFPYTFDYMSLIYNNTYKREGSKGLNSKATEISDFNTLYLATIYNEEVASKELVLEINDYLKGVTDNVPLLKGRE